MALTDKDIVITPNRGQSADPKVEFKGASSTLGPQTISLNVYPTSNGTLSFEGSAGQLFSITNTLTGTIYSVNDVSGIPSIEVLDTGLVKLAQYSGNVVVGTATDDGSKLQVRGSLRVGNGGWNSSPAGTTFSHTIAANTGNFRTVNFDGNGNTPSVWWTNGSRPYGAIDAQDPGLTFWAHNGSGWQKQITMGYGTVNIDTALQQGGNQVLHAGNYSSYALPLSGGTMTGIITTVSSGTAINFSGQSDSIGYNATSNLGTYIKGTGTTYVYGGGSFYDGSAQRAILHAGNYSSYALPLSGGTMTGTINMGNNQVNYANQFHLNNGFTISQRSLSYAQFSDWVYLPGYHGFYSAQNSAHIYPNNGSYGAWRVAGSRNGWNGIEFDTSTGNVSLMIDVNGNTSGFHHNNYGWQMRWNNGTGYIHKNAYGAGTEATILDSSNYTNYTNGIFLRAAGHPGYGDWNTFGNTQQTVHEIYQENFNAGTNTSSSNFPTSRGYSYGTLVNFGTNSYARAQVYISHAGNDLIFRGGWGTGSWNTWNRVLTDQNYTIWAPSLTGSGASGTWGISITGSAASAASVPASGITGQVGMWTSATRPGPYRLYRRDDNSDYSVQTYWTGSYWRLYGYNGDTGHADTHVGYADSAGSSGSSTDANKLISRDIRTIAPSDESASRLRFGFTSWNNNNTDPWADFLHLRSYTDSSGGKDNMVLFRKNGIGMRIWQQDFGSTTAYATYQDVLTSGNYNSYSPTLTGSGASGTWSINITGSAGSATDSTKVPLAGGTMTGALVVSGLENSIDVQHNGTGTAWRGRIISRNSSADVSSFLANYNGKAGVFAHNNALSAWSSLYLNALGSSGQSNVYLPLGTTYTLNNSNLAYSIIDASNYNSYSPTLTGTGASGTWGINITGNAATATSATDSTKVPLAGGTMTGTLFINSKLRVNNASGPSDSVFGTAADIPFHLSGSNKVNTTLLIENTSTTSIEYPQIVIRRTGLAAASRFGSLLRFADRDNTSTEISSQIYTFNRATYHDLVIEAGGSSGWPNDRLLLRASDSTNIQIGRNYVYHLKAANYNVIDNSTSASIDCSQGNYFRVTIGFDQTFSFNNVTTISGSTLAYSMTLEITHTSGTITWPASVKWPGNVLPSLTTGKTHLFMFVTDDGGSRWRGSFLSNYDN